MSDSAIEEKIRKIRQDLYDFNICGQSSLEKYLGDNRLQYKELENRRSVSPELYSSRLRSSYSAENLNFDDFGKSPKFFKDEPESTGNYKEFTLQKEESAKEKQLAKYNQELLSSLNESQSKYLKMLTEKDERILYLEQKLKKAENEIKNFTQRNNLEEMKGNV